MSKVEIEVMAVTYVRSVVLNGRCACVPQMNANPKMTAILTLHLDPTAQSRFEALRQRHYPPERNQIPAHLTLFHTLPDTRKSW